MDGQTLSFDLNRESDRLAWERFSSGEGWSDSITALGILCRKTLHTLPAPNSGLQSFGFGAGLIKDKKRKRVSGEMVWYCVDHLKISMQVYNTNQKVISVTVSGLPAQSED